MPAFIQADWRRHGPIEPHLSQRAAWVLLRHLGPAVLIEIQVERVCERVRRPQREGARCRFLREGAEGHHKINGQASMMRRESDQQFTHQRPTLR